MQYYREDKFIKETIEKLAIKHNVSVSVVTESISLRMKKVKQLMTESKPTEGQHEIIGLKGLGKFKINSKALFIYNKRKEHFKKLKDEQESTKNTGTDRTI